MTSRRKLCKREKNGRVKEPRESMTGTVYQGIRSAAGPSYKQYPLGVVREYGGRIFKISMEPGGLERARLSPRAWLARGVHPRVAATRWGVSRRPSRGLRPTPHCPGRITVPSYDLVSIQISSADGSSAKQCRPLQSNPIFSTPPPNSTRLASPGPATATLCAFSRFLEGRSGDLHLLPRYE